MKKTTFLLLSALSTSVFSMGGNPDEVEPPEATVVGVCSDAIQAEIRLNNATIPEFTGPSLFLFQDRNVSFVNDFYTHDVVFRGLNGLPSSLVGNVNQLPQFWQKPVQSILDNVELKGRAQVKFFYTAAFGIGGSIDNINMTSCVEMSDGSYVDRGGVSISYQDFLWFINPETKCQDYKATWVGTLSDPDDVTSGLLVKEDDVLTSSLNCN